MAKQYIYVSPMRANLTIDIDDGGEVDISTYTDDTYYDAGGFKVYELTLTGTSYKIKATCLGIFFEETTTRKIVDEAQVYIQMRSIPVSPTDNNPAWRIITLISAARTRDNTYLDIPDITVLHEDYAGVNKYFDAENIDEIKYQISEFIGDTLQPKNFTFKKDGYSTETSYMPAGNSHVIKTIVLNQNEIKITKQFYISPPLTINELSAPGGEIGVIGSPVKRVSGIDGRYVYAQKCYTSFETTQTVFGKKQGYTDTSWDFNADTTDNKSLWMPGKSSLDVDFSSVDSDGNAVTGKIVFEIQERRGAVWNPLYEISLNAGEGFFASIAPKVNQTQRLVITSVPSGYVTPAADEFTAPGDLLEGQVTARVITLVKDTAPGVYYVYVISGNIKPSLDLQLGLSGTGEWVTYSNPVQIDDDSDYDGYWKFTIGTVDSQVIPGLHNAVVKASGFDDYVMDSPDTGLCLGAGCLVQVIDLVGASTPPSGKGTVFLFIKPKPDSAVFTNNKTGTSETTYAFWLKSDEPYSGYYFYFGTYDAGTNVSVVAKKDGYADFKGNVKSVVADKGNIIAGTFGEPEEIEVEFDVKPVNATLKVGDKSYSLDSDEFQYIADYVSGGVYEKKFAHYIVKVIPNGTPYEVSADKYETVSGSISASSALDFRRFKVSLKLKKENFRSMVVRVAPATLSDDAVTVTGATKKITLTKVQSAVGETCGLADWGNSNLWIGVVDISDMPSDSTFDLNVKQTGYVEVTEEFKLGDFEIDSDYLKGDSGDKTGNYTLLDEGSFYCFSLEPKVVVKFDLTPVDAVPVYYTVDEGYDTEEHGEVKAGTSLEFDQDDRCHSLVLEKDGYLAYDSTVIFTWPESNVVPKRDKDSIKQFMYGYLGKDVRNMSFLKSGNDILIFSDYDKISSSVHYKISIDEYKAGKNVIFYEYTEDGTWSYNEILKENKDETTASKLNCHLLEFEDNLKVKIQRRTLCFEDNSIVKHDFVKKELKLTVNVVDQKDDPLDAKIEIYDVTNGLKWVTLEDTNVFVKSIMPNKKGALVMIKVDKDDYYTAYESALVLDEDKYETIKLVEKRKFQFKFNCSETAKVTIKEDITVLVDEEPVPFLHELYDGIYMVKIDAGNKFESFETFLNTSEYISDKGFPIAGIIQIMPVLPPIDWRDNIKTSYTTVSDVRISLRDICKNEYITDYLIAKKIIEAESLIDHEVGHSWRKEESFNETKRAEYEILRTLTTSIASYLVLTYDANWFKDYNEYQQILDKLSRDKDSALAKCKDIRFPRKVSKVK